MEELLFLRKQILPYYGECIGAVQARVLLELMLRPMLTLSHLGDLKRSMPGGVGSTPRLSLLLFEIWQPNLAQRLSIILTMNL